MGVGIKNDKYLYSASLYYSMEHPKGNIFKCRVYRFKFKKGIPFVRYFRSMYNLPEDVNILRRLVVCFQTIETDESIAFIFNRKYEKSKHDLYRVYKFNAVPCIKLTTLFWGLFGGDVKKHLYISVGDDRTIIISDNKDKVLGGIDIQTFGTIDNCMLPLDELNIGSDIDEYYSTFNDGVCVLTPTLYPGEVMLFSNGAAVYVPVNDFYDKIVKEVDGEVVLVSVLFNDKDNRFEFIK
jgi:hypothetical protein